MRCRVILTPEAQHDLDSVEDNKTYVKIEDKIDTLREDPHMRGEGLRANLQGYRDIKAAGRYRVIYWVDMEDQIATVEVVGIRKDGDKRDVYRIAAKRLLPRI